MVLRIFAGMLFSVLLWGQLVTPPPGGGSGGTISNIATGNCLTGGPITSTGTISLGTVINPKTATYQVLASDFSACKTITVASGTFTITLVASGSQPANGQYIDIVNYGSGVVTIARSGQNINGGTSSLTLNAGSATAPTAAQVWSDGTNYFSTVIGAGVSIATTPNALKGDNAGNAVAVTGTGTNCVLVNGSSALCDAPGSPAVGNVTPVTVSANSTSAQILQQLALPAGLLNTAGNSGGAYTYNGSGIYTAAALQTPTLTWTLNACTVSGCGSGTVRALATIVTSAVVTATNNSWKMQAVISNTATGSSGTLITHASIATVLTIGNLATVSNDTNTASSSTIDLTGIVYLQLTVTTSTGNAGNSITEDHSSLEPASAIGPTGATGPAGTPPFGVAFGSTAAGASVLIADTAYLQVASACTISSWTITVNAGTATFDVWKVANGTAIPTSANTITASALPAIASGTVATSSTLTGWSTSVAAGDIFGFNLKTVATATYASLQLACGI